MVLLWQLDPEIQARILSSVSDLQAFQVEFEQETYSDYFDPTHALGSLSVQRPGKMRMEYTKGEHRLAITDGDTFHEYDFDAETLSTTSQADIQDEPLVRIFLYGDAIEEHFLLDRYRDPDGVDVFRLRPRNPTTYTVEMTFDEHWRPSMIHVMGEGGDGTIFRFTNYQVNPKSPTTFVFPSHLKTAE